MLLKAHYNKWRISALQKNMHNKVTKLNVSDVPETRQRCIRKRCRCTLTGQSNHPWNKASFNIQF